MDIHVKLIFLAAALSTGTSSDVIPGWKPNYLDNYSLIPILGECYQLYRDGELSSSCRRDPYLQNQACIERIPEEEQCLILTTPTNETVVLSCTSRIRFDNCFDVYDTNHNTTVICQEVYDGYGVGITTPDNFTMLFYNFFCRTSNNLIGRQIYDNFYKTFSLDVDSKSCYKIYSPDQEITPNNCLNEDIYESCAFTVSDDCTGLMTQNNEVLVLDCAEKSKKPKEKNCFYLYSSDNEIHTVCQEKVEERCVGVVTPSNLTVLLDCFYCSDSTKIIYHNDQTRRKYRQFVKNYLTNEYSGINLKLLSLTYRTIYNNQNSAALCLYTNAHWILRTSCLGLTLQTNESVVLNCLVQNEKQEEPGCFQLISSDGQKSSICAKILNEACVGLTTPKNVSIALACYPTYEECYEYDSPPSALKKSKSILDHLTDSIHGNPKYKVGDSIVIQKYNDTDLVNTTVYKIQELQDGCIGLVIESERIVMDCLGRKSESNGCYNITTTENLPDGSHSDGKTDSLCVKLLDEGCVGLILSNNRSLLINCRHNWVSQHKDEGARTYSSYVPSFINNMRTNRPPRLRRSIN